MPNAGVSFNNWSGRFEVLARRGGDNFPLTAGHPNKAGPSNLNGRRPIFDRISGPDPLLYVPAAILLLIGTLMVLDTTYFLARTKLGEPFHFFKAQLVHIGMGVLLGAILSQFSRSGLRRLVVPVAILSIAMMMAVWIPGVGIARGGARRWVRLGPFLAEPAELLKFAMVFCLADFLARRQALIRQLTVGPLPVVVTLLPIVVLLLKQPDFGSAVTLVMLAFMMLLAAGARIQHLALGGAVAMAGLGLQILVQPYRMRRLAAFVDPWRAARGAGFQLIQSFIALGEGGKWGQGLGAGRQKMFYLPQAHTDFVFAVLIEDFGLVGGLVILALFCLLVFRGMWISQAEPDPFASLLGFGMSSLLALQVLINISVVIGLIPTKGLPLPFLSYGGSSTMMALAQLGVLLALSRRRAISSLPSRQYLVRQPSAGVASAPPVTRIASDRGRGSRPAANRF
jgi:cell division protein FtsW